METITRKSGIDGAGGEGGGGGPTVVRYRIK